MSRSEGFQEAYAIEYFEGFDELIQHWSVNFDSNGFRLPTVEEWEYIASGGDGKALFWFGNHPDRDEPDCNFLDVIAMNSLKHIKRHEMYSTWGARYDDGCLLFCLPQSYKPNPFELYNVIGNASEPCHSSEPSRNYATSGPPYNSYKIVLKGGSYWTYLPGCIPWRDDRNHSDIPVYLGRDVGIRVVRSIE
jgi:formylglycine-generating enzyme required for sulfatase activity